MTLAGLALISLLFFGSFALLYQIATQLCESIFIDYSWLLNNIRISVWAIFWTLVYKDQLKSLTTKGEWLGKESKKYLFATIAGLMVFLLVSFSGILLNAGSSRGFFAVGEFFFVISATFTLYVERMILIGRWERQTKRTIWADWNHFFGRLYVSFS